MLVKAWDWWWIKTTTIGCFEACNLDPSCKGVFSEEDKDCFRTNEPYKETDELDDAVGTHTIICD